MPQYDQTEEVEECLAVPRFRGLKCSIEDDETIDSIQELWSGGKREHLRMRADERFRDVVNTPGQWRRVLENSLVEWGDEGIVTTRSPRHSPRSVSLYTLIGKNLKPAIIRAIVVDGVIRPKTLFWAFERQWPNSLMNKLMLSPADFQPRGMSLRRISRAMRGWLN